MNQHIICSGEYGIGAMANNLALGCDCVGQIQYLASKSASSSYGTDSLDVLLLTMEAPW